LRFSWDRRSKDQTRKQNSQTPREAFLSGSISAESMPLAVFHVLPDLFPDQMQPGGAAAGDWIDQFGFVRVKPRTRDMEHADTIRVEVAVQ